MKVCALLSAGGSPFFSALKMVTNAYKCLIDDVMVITDRDCSAREFSKFAGFKNFLIPYNNKYEFSHRVTNLVSTFRADILIMLYSRMVSKEIYENIPTVNIHPSLLPSFPGLGSVQKALKRKVKFIGATAHLATSELDKGPIIAQVVSPISNNCYRKEAERISYVQKTYLISVVFELVKIEYIRFDLEKNELIWEKEANFTFTSNPSLQTKALKREFEKFQKKLGMEVVLP